MFEGNVCVLSWTSPSPLSPFLSLSHPLNTSLSVHVLLTEAIHNLGGHIANAFLLSNNGLHMLTYYIII